MVQRTLKPQCAPVFGFCPVNGTMAQPNTISATPCRPDHVELSIRTDGETIRVKLTPMEASDLTDILVRAWSLPTASP